MRTLVGALGFTLGLSVSVMAGQPTLLPPLFPHQFRYNTDAVGCGVLDRGGRFVDTAVYFYGDVELPIEEHVTQPAYLGQHTLDELLPAPSGIDAHA